MKKDKYFEFVTMYKWCFFVKSGKIPNLHQLDNTTMAYKCKYLFLFFIRNLNIFVFRIAILRKDVIGAGKIAFGKTFQFSIDF